MLIFFLISTFSQKESLLGVVLHGGTFECPPHVFRTCNTLICPCVKQKIREILMQCPYLIYFFLPKSRINPKLTFNFIPSTFLSGRCYSINFSTTTSWGVLSNWNFFDTYIDALPSHGVKPT
jgi:hypothetical protein